MITLIFITFVFSMCGYQFSYTIDSDPIFVSYPCQVLLCLCSCFSWYLVKKLFSPHLDLTQVVGGERNGEGYNAPPNMGGGVRGVENLVGIFTFSN